MPTRQKRQRKRTVRVITAYRPWTDRVPRGRRYLHMRVLPTFFVQTGVAVGAVAMLITLTTHAMGDLMTPDRFVLSGVLGLACGFYITLNEILARPDRVIW